MNTDYRKDARSGWRADTEVALNFDIEGKPAFLQFQTYKYEGQLISRAGVLTKDNGFTTTRMFRDFSGRLIVTRERCTEKNVKEQHANLLQLADRIEELARTHHANLGDLVVEDA